jgi:repressor LexA
LKSLTPKQAEIYNFIARWQANKGYPPTQAEIRNQFKFSSLNAVRSHLELIEKKGYVRLDPGKARGIHLIKQPAPAIKHQEDKIPLLGNIAAGHPIWAEQNFDDYLPVSPNLFSAGELFALRVRGDSMTGAGINDNDFAVIKRQNYVENGEIAAVLIEQEATLKRVYLSSNSILLKADNPEFKDLQYSKAEGSLIQILGHYMGIIRSEKKRYHS